MRKIFALIVFIAIGFVSQAQKKISGRVVEATTNTPLEGATIKAKGHSAATQTDVSGTFTLSAPDNVTVLIISYAGFETKEVAVTAGNLEIVLERKASLDEVVVVGSRNLSRTRVQTPAPVDIIPISQFINQVGQVDLNQLLTYVAPSFQSSRQTIADGTDHIDPAQLRGLGSDQVLVLINGKRRHQSALVNVNGTVNRGQVGTDLGAIPASAIERVEVLRDGAAAQYGSDAIAGVINIVLKKTTTGFSGNISYGTNVSSYPKNWALNKLTGKNPDEKTSVVDGANFQAALNYGLSLNKKGFLNINAEFIRRGESNRTGTYTGQIYPSVGGVVKDDSIMAARGTNRNTFDMRIGNSQITGGSVFVNSQYELGAGWKLNAFGGFSKKGGEAAGFYRYPNSIFSGAGSLYRAQALSLYPEGFLPLINSNIKDYSVSVGVSGKLGKWDASFSNTFGLNDFGYRVTNSINYSQFAVNPNPQTEFNAGAIRFLQNTINADITRKFNWMQGLNIAYGYEFRVDQYSQRAGEEASYRNYNTAAGAAAGSQVFAGFTPPYAGNFSRNSFSLYTDVELDVTRSFLAAGALRFENYSDFGSTLNYKLASRLNIVKGLTARAAMSTGFRAPSMQQRFYAKTNTLFVSTPSGLQPVESGTFPNGSRPAQILGIPELKQETSRNYSAGFTANPVKGLEITLDGYIINIKNRIVLTNNFTGGTNPTLTQLLSDAGASQANFFTNAIDTKSKGVEAVVNYNFSIARKHKIRITGAYTYIDNKVVKDANGNPIIKASTTLVNSGQLGNYFNREDQSRIEVANPRSKGSFMINYNYNKLGVMLRFASFGRVTYLDPTLNVSNPASWPVNAFTGQRETLDQTFSAKVVTDLSFSYTIGKTYIVTVGANNLFDVYQDIHTHSNNMSAGRFIYSRRVQQMGFNGRYLFARIAFNLGR
ncbi:MAG: TonB-dependent receptor [Chitinophagaceae bacterium]|nr:TonB-dependent receptor [Chitinophagaceae bacterium]